MTLDPVRLQALRVRRGLLKNEVARLAAVNQTSASQAMNGKPVGLRVARALAAALGVPLEELLESVLATGTKASAAARVVS